MNNQYLFNVKYYDGLYPGEKDEISRSNEKLLNYTLMKEKVPAFNGPADTTILHMKTVYPGLLIGTGNPHSAKFDGSGEGADDEIKLGFTLDHVTGLPYIPGSTVKGVLRSIFKKPGNRDKDETREHYEARLEAYNNRLSYIKEIMTEIIGKTFEDLKKQDPEEMIKKFESEVFGEEGSKKADVFFDAYPVRGNSKTGKLFAFESITPHSMFKDPTPLRLLKVIPDVIFEFRFLIKDSVAIPEMTKEKKVELFKRVISDFGMGAKTNVGFGVFVPYDEELIYLNYDNDNEAPGKKVGNSGKTEQPLNNQRMKETKIIEAKIEDYNAKKTSVILRTHDNKRASLFFKDIPGAKPGKIDEKFPKGTILEIQYEGKNDEGYDKWKFIRVKK